MSVYTDLTSMEDNYFEASDNSEQEMKKVRSCSTSSTDTVENEPAQQRPGTLELDTVKELFQRYDLAEGDNIPCCICGKHYKSRVCVKKHLWEHSLYWDLFEGLNKQQRVLSIQAAIILSIKSNPSLSVLLVTSPASSKKKEKKEASTKVSNKSANRRDLLHDNRKRKRKHSTASSIDQESGYTTKQRFEFVES